jgi:hypothetical protein
VRENSDRGRISVSKSSINGLERRLLIQEEYSSGIDERARAAHSLLIDSWSVRLHPE